MKRGEPTLLTYSAGPSPSRRRPWLLAAIVSTFTSCVFATALTLPVYGAEANLTWTPPSQNTDGSPLTDLAGYRIYAGCNQSGTYELQPATISDHAVTSYVYEGLPHDTTCYFVSTALNSAGVESAFSNEASKIIDGPPLEPPGTTTIEVEWSESAQPEEPVMSYETESFNGSNGTQLETLNPNWAINTGAIDIQGNAAAGDQASTFSIARYQGDWNPDQFAQAVVANIGDSNNIGVAVRCADDGSGDCYAAHVDTSLGGSLYPVKMTGGSFGYQTGFSAKVTGLGIANGDIIRIEAQGDQIRCYLNGELITTSTDTSFADGSPGINTYSNTGVNRIDDWIGGDLAGYTEQPPDGTDAAGPFAADLSGVYYAVAGADVLANATNDEGASLTLSTGVDGDRVLDFVSESAAYRAGFSADINNWPEGFSVIAAVYVPVADGASSVLVGTTTSTNTTQSSGWALKSEQFSATGFVGMTLGDTAGGLSTNVDDVSSIASPAGELAYIGATFDRATDTIEYFVYTASNGLERDTSVVSISADTARVIDGYLVGAWRKNTGTVGNPLPAGSEVSLALIWNRVWSNAEMANLIVNPWQVFAESGGGSAAADIDIPAPVVAATALVQHTVSAAISIPAVSLSAEAEAQAQVSAAIGIPQAVLSALGSVERSAQGAIDLPAATLQSIASVARSVAAEIVTPAAELSGAASSEKTAQGDIDVPAPTLSASGDVERSAAGAVVVPVPEVAADGAAERSAAGEIDVPGPVLSGSGHVARTVSSGINLPAIGMTANTITENSVRGEVTIVAPSLAATAGVERSAAGQIQMPQMVFATSASIVRNVAGALSISLPELAASASLSEKTAAGAVSIPAVVLAANAEVAREVSAALGFPVPVVSSEAAREANAAAVINLPAAELLSTVATENVARQLPNSVQIIVSSLTNSDQVLSASGYNSDQSVDSGG